MLLVVCQTWWRRGRICFCTSRTQHVEQRRYCCCHWCACCSRHPCTCSSWLYLAHTSRLALQRHQCQPACLAEPPCIAAQLHHCHVTVSLSGWRILQHTRWGQPHAFATFSHGIASRWSQHRARHTFSESTMRRATATLRGCCFRTRFVPVSPSGKYIA